MAYAPTVPVLFLAWDLSMIGYLASPKAGAWTDNAVHSYVGPGLLLSHALLAGARWSAFLVPAWAFHIVADRLLGRIAAVHAARHDRML